MISIGARIATPGASVNEGFAATELKRLGWPEDKVVQIVRMKTAKVMIFACRDNREEVTEGGNHLVPAVPRSLHP